MIECNHLYFIGARFCELCGKDMGDPLEKYRCKKCGEIMPYDQQEHDLRRHRYG
jgi:hypothetical protein